MIARSILTAPAWDPDATAQIEAAAGIVVLNVGGAPDGLHDAALEAARSALGRPGVARWVRLGPPDADLTKGAVGALCRLRPAAFVLSCVETAADVQHFGAMLAVAEAEAGLDDGSTRLVAMAESAASLFELIAIARASPRLAALGWDGEALALDFGGETAREHGGWTDPLQTARTLLLAACADARLPAIDAPFTGADPAALQREARHARRDGFSAKFALSVRQSEIIDEAFAARA